LVCRQTWRHEAGRQSATTLARSTCGNVVALGVVGTDDSVRAIRLIAWPRRSGSRCT